MEENEELQEPEKKKKKKGSSLSMPMIGVILFGVIVLNILLIIAVLKIYLPEGNLEADDNDKKTEKVEKSNKKDTEKDDGDYSLSELDEEELEFLEKEAKRKYLETDDITTNPKGSSAFVIIQLGIKFVANDELEDKLLSPESDYMKKLMGNTRATIIKEIGLHTADELLLEGRADLPEIFRKKLKPLFKEKKLFLREITITKFMVQK